MSPVEIVRKCDEDDDWRFRFDDQYLLIDESNYSAYSMFIELYKTPCI